MKRNIEGIKISKLGNICEPLYLVYLEKEMATHPSVLAWRIPGMAEPGGLRLWGRTELDTTEATWQ